MKCHDHIHQPDCCTATAVRALEEKLTNRIHELELANGRLSKRIYDLETDTKFGYLDSSLTTLCQRVDKVESAIEELSATVQALDSCDKDELLPLLPCAHCGSEEVSLMGRSISADWYVVCDNCFMRTPTDSQETVIIRWNTRA